MDSKSSTSWPAVGGTLRAPSSIAPAEYAQTPAVAGGDAAAAPLVHCAHWKGMVVCVEDKAGSYTRKGAAEISAADANSRLPPLPPQLAQPALRRSPGRDRLF